MSRVFFGESFHFFAAFRLQCIPNVIHPMPWIFVDDLVSFLNFISKQGERGKWEKEGAGVGTKNGKALEKHTHIQVVAENDSM